jgi:copper homeostasis protein (lipoprotein)
VAIATSRLESPGAPPYDFILEYNPAEISAARRYAVRARITDRERVVFVTTDPHLVVTQGHGREANVVLRKVGDPLPEPEAAASGTPPPSTPAPMAVARTDSAPATLAALPATFTGTLPCEGCTGTRVHLNLFGDDSFFVRFTDVGRDSTSRDDLGSWALSSDGRLLVMESRSGDVWRFALRDAMSMRAVDAAGADISAATRTDLRKAARFQPVEVYSEMQGAYRMTGDVGLFTECSTGRTWSIAGGEGAAIVQSHYMQSRKNAGDGVLMTVEARVTERPRATGMAPDLHVSRVVTTATGAMCVPRFAAAPLQRTNWRLTELAGITLSPATDVRSRPYLVLDDNTARFSGAGGCNRLVGEYDIEGRGIAFSVSGTMSACPATASDTAFTAALRAARTFQVAGRELRLFDEAGTVIAVFATQR